MKNFDPDISELREYIADKWGKLLDKETLQTDGEVAIYWFASEYYNGQGSNLYEALCATRYEPGRMIDNICGENDMVCSIFNSLIDKYDPDNGEYVINEETGEKF